MSWMKIKWTTFAVGQEYHYQLKNGRRKIMGLHLHVYLLDHAKLGIANVNQLLREYLTSLKNSDTASNALGLDVQPCKNPQRWVTYLSKNDVMCVCEGIDFDWLSPMTRLHSLASVSTYSSIDPLAFNLRHQCNYVSGFWETVYLSHQKDGSCTLCAEMKVPVYWDGTVDSFFKKK